MQHWWALPGDEASAHVYDIIIFIMVHVCIHLYVYILQESWIQHATVRDNILFGKEFKADKYEKVIQACALQQVCT